MAERKTELYFRMLREMRDVVFSTVAEDGTPRARIIDVMLVEGEKLYFLTAVGKDFYEELMRNGQVAIAGLNSSWETIRVWGRVRNVRQENCLHCGLCFRDCPAEAVIRRSGETEQ